MEVVHNILDWLSKNSRNLSEVQKKEVYDLLNSIRGELGMGTQMGSTSRDHQPSSFRPAMDHGGKEYHGFAREDTHVSLQSKIDQVTRIVNKETGYINGKIDTITTEYKEQIKALKDKVRELENKKNQREQEEKKVSDRDIDHLTQSLKDLMHGIAKESQSQSFPFPSNSNPLPPQGPPPPYQPYPSTGPNPNVAYFPPPPPHHIPPQFHGPSGPYRFSMGASFPPSHLNPTPSDMNQNVYRFSGNRGSGPSSYHNRGAGHPRPRFDHKPFHRGNDEKFRGNLKKNYCDPHWKKFDHKNKDQGSKNEPPNTANEKSHHKTAPQDKQASGDSNRGKPKTYADQSRNKRDQQFGKNRSQNQDDGAESDSSVASHVSSKNTRKESTQKTGPPRDSKAAPNKPHQTPTGKTDNSKSKNREDKEHKNPTSGSSSKNTQKESKFKTQHSCDSAATQNKSFPKSTSKTDDSDLLKLQYPPEAEALKKGIDINKTLDSPSMCLGKKNGQPVSRAANSLADIYNFEREFGSCQVIRF